jgi:PAS domain S-box-containing protein
MEYVETIRALVVDDSEFFGSLTADQLETNHGIRAETVTSGERALARLEEAPFDCVVSDYDMPEMDGLALYRQVEQQYTDLPFIILTGRSDSDIATEAIDRGVDDFLQKEAVSEDDDFDVLANRVENVVSQRKSRREYELVVENIPEIIAQIRQDGTILAVNDAMAQTFDVPQSTLVNSDVAAVLPDEVARRWTTHGETALVTDERQTFESTVGDRHYDTTIVPVEIGGASGIYQVIARDITSRVEYANELEATTSQLELINRLVRHDIRNDINVMRQWAALLDDHLEDDETAQEFVDRIERSSEHIVELTNISQEFIQLLSTDQDVSFEPISLRTALTEEVEKCRMSYDEATFIFNDTVPAVDVRANEMLVSVFRNLLNNAIQHNKSDDPEVRISTRLNDDETVTVIIADNGPGVPEAQREEIFGRGEQGPESAGTGIGLYLVDRLVDEYGGTVHVEDSHLGGAAFVVELPLAE